MKIALYSRAEALHGADELDRLFEALSRHAFTVQLNAGFAERVHLLTGRTFSEKQLYHVPEEVADDVRMLISYGGDGTFLEAVRLLDLRPIPIIGINSGRLGFLANIPLDGVETALSEISQGKFEVEERTMLAVEGDFIDSDRYPYAFNEVTVQRHNTSMIAVEVFVDDEMIATCHGDGMLISTSSGSTAYSLSVGGPVVAPSCRCFVISPIAPHNLTMRPVIIPETSKIIFRVRTRGEKSFVSLDNRNYLADDGTELRICKAKKSIFLAHLQNISFYETLRNKMMWGIDSRDRQKKCGKMVVQEAD